jgi:hypothetical protein
MSQNPINLIVRFILELLALIILGYWGWSRWEGVFRFVFAIATPLLAAILWGMFRVPGDASSSGHAPVPVPGFVRLLLEFVLFTGATLALMHVGKSELATIFGAVSIIHYIVSYDRVIWLLRQ